MHLNNANKILKSLLIVILLFSITQINFTSAKSENPKVLGYEKDKSNSNNPNHNSESINMILVKILSANYEDSDDDAVEDDVFSSIAFDTEFVDPQVRVYITLTLILPSGLTFYYEIEEIAHKVDFSMDFYFINQATEPGWYQLIVTAATQDMIDDGLESINSLIFDPPGGKAGGQPFLAY